MVNVRTRTEQQKEDLIFIAYSRKKKIVFQYEMLENQIMNVQ